MNETKIEKIKEMIIQDNLFNIEPGPGYYDIINSNSIYSKNKYKSNISSFGSKEKRETLKLKNEESPGPGLYYNMTKPKKKPIKLINHRKNNEDILNLYKIKKDIYKYNTGPGAYEKKSQFDNIIKESYVGPHEIRFPNKDIIQPGPGKYDITRNWTNTKITLPIRKSPIKVVIKKNYDTPGVGAYRSEVVNSIQYHNKSKENIYQSLIAPFNSCSERILMKSKSTSNIDNPGPGSYNINLYNNAFRKIPEKKINKILPLSEWIKEKENDKARVGPGSYINYDYNNWHKKSYNILYV